MRQSWEKIINGEAATATITTGKIDIRQVYSLSVIGVSSSGSNTGAFSLQVSNDICPYGNVVSAFTPATASWVDLPATMFDGSGTVASGATVTLAVKQIPYAWLRVVWTPSGGGAGTVTATVNSQGF